MAAINTTARPVKIRIDWTQDGNVSRAKVGNATGTVVSLCGRHFAYVDVDGSTGGNMPQTSCDSKLAAKRLVGRKIRELIEAWGWI